MCVCFFSFTVEKTYSKNSTLLLPVLVAIDATQRWSCDDSSCYAFDAAPPYRLFITLPTVSGQLFGSSVRTTGQYPFPQTVRSQAKTITSSLAQSVTQSRGPFQKRHCAVGVCFFNFSGPLSLKRNSMSTGVKNSLHSILMVSSPSFWRYTYPPCWDCFSIS